ncbi:MAG: hypothetical protein ACREP7_10445 [Lysobacter sp.]
MATYRHEWEVGDVSGSVTALSAMSILQSRPNDIFPFTVSGRGGVSSIRIGVTYDLIDTVGAFNNWGTGPDPVRVITATPLLFTFLTLSGHHRGAGQTISFETFERGGKVILCQYGTYTWAIRHPFSSLFNVGANVGASGAWALQAHNLRVALGTAGSIEGFVIPGARTVWPSF